MSPLLSANTVSTAHSGDLTIPKDKHRSYFFLVMTTGAGTVSFGGGNGAIPLEALQHYNPAVCPIGEIKIVTSNDFIIHMG